MLTYVPGFSIFHLLNSLDKVKSFNGQEAVKGETDIVIQLGLEEFTLKINEAIEVESFDLAIHQNGGENDFKVSKLGNVVRIEQIGLCHISQIRDALFELFGFLIEEGHRSAVEVFLFKHQTWLVDLWSCVSEVYFTPGFILNANDAQTVEAFNENISVLKSVYSVVS